ncbi:type II toxin-antitoxin system Y4mF family antitoxin [Arthrobacter sp. Z4-13]
MAGVTGGVNVERGCFCLPAANGTSAQPRCRNVRAGVALVRTGKWQYSCKKGQIGTLVPTGVFAIRTSFSDFLGAEVRARRAALRLTQHDLAQLAGVSERFVRFVEQGKQSVQLDSLLALLETLGLELQLTTRTRTPDVPNRTATAGAQERRT